MRLGRLRWSEVAILIVSIGLTVDLFAVDWFRSEGGGSVERGLDSDLFGVLVAVVAGLGFVAVLQTGMRRAATGGLAAHVALTVLCPLVVLVGLLSAIPGSDGMETTAGAWLGLLGAFLVFGLSVVALRDESRGFKPDPGATVLEMPPVGERAQSVDS